MKLETRGVLLSVQPFSEHDLIASFFTADHGLLSGVIGFGQRGKMKDQYQIGNFFDISWMARLEDHLGRFKLNFVQSYQQYFLFSNLKLACLNSCVVALKSFFPEKQSYPDLYHTTQSLLVKSSVLSDEDFLKLYFQFELELLSELGFGCDFSCCALTGRKDNLAYVSPITGRAACREAVSDYADKLLPLPAFLCDDNAFFIKSDLKDAYDLIDYFFRKHFEDDGQLFFDIRQRLLKFCA